MQDIDMVRYATIASAARRDLIRKLYPYALLLLIGVPALTLRLAVDPPIWFDEGYKTNAARTLAERGVYGTYTSAGYVLFDPGISSGPIDVVLVALSFRMFGAGVVQARLVIALFALLALGCVYAIAAWIYGRAAGLFIALVLLAAPVARDARFLFVGRQVLGEVPALAMLLLGLLLWFHSWHAQRWRLAALSGLVLGLGLLSKTQVGIALGPALLLIAAGRVVARQSRVAVAFAPAVVMAGVVGGWGLLGGWLVSPEARRENSLMLADAIRSNLLTDLLGRNLGASALAILVLMGAGVLGCGWRVLRRPSGARLANDAQWAEATLALFVLLTGLWFALLSVGWPRYAFAGLTIGLLLAGKLAWDLFERLRAWLERERLGRAPQAYRVALCALGCAALVINVYPPLRFDQPASAQQMADYIRAQVPRGAVVESWEWELDALSGHWEYHHPHQRYLFLAIRQFAQQPPEVDLRYDLLQADPDFLIAGPFSDWTQIYDQRLVARHFSKLAEFGAYRIYRRVRYG